jgi:hypothetical protein
MTAHRLDRPLVIILTALLLVGCSPVATIAAPAPARTTFATRLRQLSAQPAIRRAARYRLTLRPDDPESLATAAQSSPESPQEVRAALAGDVDGVVIVAWLVSFGAMGAWTADDPRNPETVSIATAAERPLVQGAASQPPGTERPPTTPTRVVTFEELARLVQRPRARRKLTPPGQIALFQ